MRLCEQRPADVGPKENYSIDSRTATECESVGFPQVFRQFSPILRHKEISMNTKTQIIKALFTPTTRYQSGNWTLIRKEREMLTPTAMWVSEKQGKTRMDTISLSEAIIRQANMQPAEQTANKNTIRWWLHV